MLSSHQVKPTSADISSLLPNNSSAYSKSRASCATYPSAPIASASPRAEPSFRKERQTLFELLPCTLAVAEHERVDPDAVEKLRDPGFVIRRPKQGQALLVGPLRLLELTGQE